MEDFIPIFAIFAVFGTITAIVFGPTFLKYREKRDMQETVRLAVDKGQELPPELLGLGTAGVAGLAFMIPDFLIGTPFPQVRTSQMLAICMALPYLAMAVAKAAPALPRGLHPAVKPFVPRPRLVST